MAESIPTLYSKPTTVPTQIPPMRRKSRLHLPANPRRTRNPHDMAIGRNAAVALISDGASKHSNRIGFCGWPHV